MSGNKRGQSILGITLTNLDAFQNENMALQVNGWKNKWTETGVIVD